MEIPKNLLYTVDHEWIKVEGKQAWCGITHFAQNALGEIVFVDINQEQSTFKKGDVLGAIEAVKTVSDIFMPVSAKILLINPDLEKHPELINQDPYGKGWIIKIELSNPQELEKLMDAKHYQDSIQ